MKKVLIGHVGVDSGQLIVMDPGYIDGAWYKQDYIDTRAIEMPDGIESDELGYNTVCHAKDFQPYAAHLFPLGHEGLAVSFNSGYGDGCYPVYGYLNDEGRVVRVEILMDEEE